MTENREFKTEILLAGRGAESFFDRRGITDLEQDSLGNFVVARFVGKQDCIETSFGKLAIEHRLANNSRNREVVVFGALRKKGIKFIRKISLKHDAGFGFQQFSNNILIGVRTDAEVEIFIEDKV